MYSGVPTSWPQPVTVASRVSCSPGGLGDAEIDDLGDRHVVVLGAPVRWTA